jgi:hypothetical protein
MTNLPASSAPPSAALSVPPGAPPMTLPWLLRRGLGFSMLTASLMIPGCVGLFT